MNDRAVALTRQVKSRLDRLDRDVDERTERLVAKLERLRVDLGQLALSSPRADGERVSGVDPRVRRE